MERNFCVLLRKDRIISQGDEKYAVGNGIIFKCTRNVSIFYFFF